MPTKTAFRDLPNGIADMVVDLSCGKMSGDRWCHLDPDIDHDAYRRRKGWRGALGQAGAAQSHLENQGVERGDLFLFWGLFRPAKRNGRWRYAGRKEHRLFGWLQVDEVVRVGDDPAPALLRYPWLADHPHLQTGWGRDNVVYVGTRKLDVMGKALDLPGWGVLAEGQRLTVADKSPSHWTVPDWLHPRSGGPGMSYNPPGRWLDDGTVKVAARGQEFVADVGDDPRVAEWLRTLVAPRS